MINFIFWFIATNLITTLIFLSLPLRERRTKPAVDEMASEEMAKVEQRVLLAVAIDKLRVVEHAL